MKKVFVLIAFMSLGLQVHALENSLECQNTILQNEQAVQSQQQNKHEQCKAYCAPLKNTWGYHTCIIECTGQMN